MVVCDVIRTAIGILAKHRVSLRMVMRYAHLAPGYLSDEVKKLDTPISVLVSRGSVPPSCL